MNTERELDYDGNLRHTIVTLGGGMRLNLNSASVLGLSYMAGGPWNISGYTHLLLVRKFLLRLNVLKNGEKYSIFERCYDVLGGEDMGRIAGIRIKNYGSLKDIKMGKLLFDSNGKELTSMNAIIGQSGTGKSTLADAFGFLADCLEKGVEVACDLNARGGFEKLISQGAKEPIEFEIYYRETSNEPPITYELSIGLDKYDRPIVEKERLRQRRANERYGRPMSFLFLEYGKGFAFKGNNSGFLEEENQEIGDKVDVELADPRQLGIVTLGELREHPRIVKFKNFLKNWYLCYFSPTSAREIPNAGPQKYLNRFGNNVNNVAQFLYREDPKDFLKVLRNIQTKLPDIKEIRPVKLQNGQLVLEFLEQGFDKPFYSQKMSDGTLKLFAYYLQLYEKDARPLVFIEEPENGLYHKYRH